MSPHDVEEQTPAEAPCELEATPEMCYYCFDVLVNNLVGGSPKPKPLTCIPTTAECPIFVTWDKQQRGGNFHLRGCIGTLSPRSLRQAVGDYALTAALRDSRFDAIVAAELPQLRVAVSLLVQYEVCQDAHDWQVGVHGILIKFDAEGRHYSATYLPEVSMEQNWNQEQAVESLVRKSGYHGRVDVKSIQCTRYQSSKHRITYQEYLQHRGTDPLANAAYSEKKGWCFSL